MALVQRGTIRQKEFADEIGVEPRTLRRHLTDMRDAGMPIEREEDHPHVFWSVPKGWLPGGIAVSSAEAMDVIRILIRATQSSSRDRLLQRFLHRAGRGVVLPSVDAVVSPSMNDREEELVRVFEDALATRRAVAMSFFSSRRGQNEDRIVSVQRLVFSDPAKFIGVCHRDDTLKWFRFDNVQRARLDESTEYRWRDDDAIERVASSFDGFHQQGEDVEHRFIVRAPEHRWVGKQLGSRVVAEPCADGMRYSLATPSLEALARFVVSLGGAARIETPELAAAVEVLARGALDALASSPRST